MACSERREPIWEEAFFVALRRKRGKIRTAAELAGVAHPTVYYHRHRRPEFENRIRQVRDELRQQLVDRAKSKP